MNTIDIYAEKYHRNLERIAKELRELNLNIRDLTAILAQKQADLDQK